MKQCPKCRKAFDSAFCPDCGAPMEELPESLPRSPAPKPAGVSLFQLVPGWVWATAAIVVLLVVLFARSAGTGGDGGPSSQPPDSSSRPSYTSAELDALFADAAPFLPALYEQNPDHYQGQAVYATGKVVHIRKYAGAYYLASIATQATPESPDEYTTGLIYALYPYTAPGADFYAGDVVTVHGYAAGSLADAPEYPAIDTYRIIMAEDAPSSPAVTTYRAGMYKVGVDIPAGLYVLTAQPDASGYYAVTSDSTGSFDSILFNENYHGRCYVELEAGQYVQLSRCTAVAFDDAEPLSPVGGTLSGEWLKVGFDIEPGEYKLTATADSAYCAVHSRAESGLGAIVTNGNFSGSRYITVSAGQYLQISRCTLTLN